MNYPDYLITINEFAEHTLKAKGSAFTSQVYQCEADEETDEILTTVRKKYYDATHHCYAYKLLNGIFKYSDDGEPNGTAGIRIYNAIEHFELVNILVIVIRYFGGTKLGIGPLGKAYYTAASNVLSESKKIKKFLYNHIRIESAFEHTSHIHRIISKHKAIIANSEYGDYATFECLIKPAELESVKKQLIDLSKGKIKITLNKSNYYK